MTHFMYDPQKTNMTQFMYDPQKPKGVMNVNLMTNSTK